MSITTRASSNPAVGDLLQLVNDRTGDQVVISPTRGALVTSLRLGGRELLYLDAATLEDPAKNVRGGIPVLFPTPGKLDGDRWQRGEQSGTMKQHGFARNFAWAVEERLDGEAPSVTLGLGANERTRASYPWEFHTTLAFALEAGRLRITTTIRNPSASTLPFALGFHPYFLVTDKARASIATRATRAFDNVTKTEVPFRGFDLTAAEVDVHLLDHGSSQSELSLGDGARIVVRASPDFSVWVVWTLAGKDFVCLEPWTAPGNALNSGVGLSTVEAGESKTSWIEICG
jgi:galactose mutarotase-like enzyme